MVNKVGKLMTPW